MHGPKNVEWKWS